jgi:hypothetical protein
MNPVLAGIAKLEALKYSTEYRSELPNQLAKMEIPHQI